MDNFPLKDIQMNPSEGQLTQAATNLQSYSGIFRQQVQNSPYYGGGPAAARAGNLDTFFSKVGSVFSEGAHMVEGAGGWIGRHVAEGVMNVVHLPSDFAHLGQNSYTASTYGMKNKMLEANLNQLMKEHKSGYVNKSDYKARLHDIFNQQQELGHSINDFLIKNKSDFGKTVKDLTGTAADIATVATAGLTSPLSLVADKGAVDLGTFLMSKQATDLFAPAESVISKLSVNKALMESLPSYVQNNVKASVTDTIINGSATMASKDFVRASAINLAVKYPLAYNWLSGTGNEIYTEMQSGKYGEAVKNLGYNSALLILGGPLGEAFNKLGPAGVRALSGAIHGDTSFIDTFSKAVFDDPYVVAQTIKDDPAMVKAFQALEATNVSASGGRVTGGVYRVIDGLKGTSVPAFKDTGMSPAQYIKTYVMDWHEAQSALTESLIKSGMSEAEASKYVVGRWTKFDAHTVATVITTGRLAPNEKATLIAGITNDAPGATISKARQDMMKNFNDFTAANPNLALSNNATLRDQVTHIINTSDSVQEVEDRIKAITASFGVKGAKAKNISQDVVDKIAKLGYVPIIPKKLEAPFIQGTQKLVTAGAEGEFFQRAVQPLPVFREFGAFLTKAGLSPDRAAQSTQDVFDQNFNKNIKETSLFKGTPQEKKFSNMESQSWAKLQYQKISDYVNDVNKRKMDLKQPPITNVRQLTKNELAEALDIPKAQAGEVQDALMQSVLDMTWEQRGMADKLVDVVGRGPMQKYLRLQGAGRFAWNPIFSAKKAFKTEFLVQSATGGKAPTLLGTNKVLRIIFSKYYANLDSTDSLLRSKDLYGSGLTNEAATEETAGAGTTGLYTNARGLNKTQRLSVAGLVNSMADRVGMSPEQFVNNYTAETQGAIESLLHYNPHSSFLNSNMAKMLNVTIFPFRFNVKVGTYMTKMLMRQDWVTRTAVLNGLIQAHSFLTSEQGQVWYSQNSDAIGLLNYFSPMETLSTVARLGGITHESVGSFGELGGLPVGFIPQLLQAEGLWHPNSAYINPKTGIPGSEYIPLSNKAALATAISSFMGSLFTYPGSVVGLPSKTGTLAKFTSGLTGDKSTDWRKVPDTNLTPEQQQFSQTVQRLHQNQEPINNIPPQQPFKAPSIFHPTKSGTAAPIYTASQKRGKSTKKTLEPVTPLPGQTSIGQIP